MPDEPEESLDQSNDPGQHLRETEEDAAPVAVDGSAEEADPGHPLPYLIAAIGASAGGVEAYIELFNHLSDATGIAFVVIPHQMADHKSHLVEILARHTTMPVNEIASGMRPQPNQVYVLPPNARVQMTGGVFYLEDRETEGAPRSIDYFFRSLAADQKSRAIGVVLSGTDADGALGLKTIKGEGGITMVQSPETARFPQMPRSSISMDHVDKILPPDQLAAELAVLGKQFSEPVVRILDEGAAPANEGGQFSRILSMLRSVSGVDFRLYKPNTIRRRVARRMLLQRIQTLSEYVGFLQGNAKELRALQEDALINVTRFFRDPGVFDALKTSVLPRIFEERQPNEQVRIWVAGCSTGEEVYSIAICLLEYLTGQNFEPPIQIFGTDASEENIQRARAGIYPESIAGEVSSERLRRFFTKAEKGYQISKRVRDLCIFARQNLCHDPPFSKMDLISCRNVLIYMGADLQKQVLPTFHYALRQNGYLILGTSETIREFTDLFQLVDRKNKIFARIGGNGNRSIVNLVPQMFVPDAGRAKTLLPLPENWGEIELQRAADRIVLARYGPPGVVINDRMEIIQSRGHTAPFIELAQGSASLQLTRMLKDSIVTQVTQAVRRAIQQDIPVRVDGILLSGDEQEQEVSLEVLPIHTTAPRQKVFLVLFAPPQQGIQPRMEAKELPAGELVDRDQLVERLRQDLSSTKLYLQTLLEERDAKNQELVSANEEIQSANEEMQSTNEELETTKEELQSSNEELQTVNDELQQRNTVLTQTTNDLSNLLNSVNLPVLMLNNDLQIRHFTPPTQKLMNLRAPDVGRPLSEIRMNLKIDHLEPLFAEVLETLAPRELEVQDTEGHWYLLRVRPYRTTDNKIEGVVVVLLDIDQLRRSQQELRGARDFARSVIANIPLPLAVVDLEFRIRDLNDAFRDLAGLGANEDVDRRLLTDIASFAWGLDEPLRSHLENLRQNINAGGSFAFEYKPSGDNGRVFNIQGRTLKPDGNTFLLITIEDITSHHEVERFLKIERERLATEVATAAQELGRTQEELRALAGSLFTSQEDERRRVARELHDDISQKLALLAIDVEQMIPEIGKSKKSHAARALEHVRSSVSSLAESVRGISHALHPSVIDDLGLAPAIKSLVSDFSERDHMIATFSSQNLPASIPFQIATGLYRITQEALRNVSKHAGRTHVKVLLRGEPDRLILQVTDFGEGFDTRVRNAGLGLIGMEERARLIKGSFKIESEVGKGTEITVEVPWPQES